MKLAKQNIKNRRSKLYIIYVIFFSVVIVFSIVVFYYLQKQNSAAVRINLAGRQRMLSQRITKKIVMIHTDAALKKNAKFVDSLTSSVDIFEKTAYALAYGGEVPVKLKDNTLRSIPEIHDPDTKNKLTDVLSDWKGFKRNILSYLEHHDRKSLDYILEHNEELLMIIDNSVYGLQVFSEKNGLIIRSLITGGVIIVVFVLLLSLFRVIRDLKVASERIRTLEQALPICSNCKKIRIDDEHPEIQESWQTIEDYLHVREDMLFTHGICPDCMKKLYPDTYNRIKKD